jgi:hypothetical protein
MGEWDAELREWRRVGRAVIGYIYNDSKGRFPDGATVRTSKVKSIDGNILRTTNTTYLLVGPEATYE